MSTHPNIMTVNKIYQAFGAGDVPTILETLHPDIEWEVGLEPTKIKIPWIINGRGRDTAVRFFTAMQEHLAFEAFEVHEVMQAGEWVIGLVSLRARVIATGRTLVERFEPHLWRFDEHGRITGMRHRADTLHQAEAAGLV